MDLYEKKYKKALEKLQEALAPGEDGCEISGLTRDCLENIFPELKESEDERIRKKLICFVENWKKYNPNSPFDDYAVYTSDSGECDKILAWLEKQGEQTHAELSQQEVTKTSDQELESKFHKGEWIIHQGTENIYQVVACIDNQYQLKYGDNYTVQKCTDVDRCARLWTIADAKDGDVLVAKDNRPFIFTGEFDVQDDNPTAYCGINSSDKFITGNGSHWTFKDGIKPVTKEQRDTFFVKMADAGYKWDSEKKELKKIGVKTLDADKVIAWLVANICDFELYVKLFKKDFGL